MGAVGACAVLAGLATGAVYCGSTLSTGGGSAAAGEGDDVQDAATTMTYAQALTLPVYASASLIIFFFFFSYIQYLLLALIVFSAGYATFHLLRHYARELSGNDAAASVLSGLLTAITVIEFFRSNHYVFSDVLGISLSVFFIVSLQFPSVKIAVLSLSLLVVYDIFWVFLSEYFFSSNVMVTVATQSPSNPVRDVAQLLDLPWLQHLSSSLQLPLKLVVPYGDRFLMLGLGDVALPGAFVALSLRCDIYLTKLFQRAKLELNELDVEIHGDNSVQILDAESERSSLLSTSAPTGVSANTMLFHASVIGYVLGLGMAFWVSFTSRHAQPALIYLVPCTVGACLLRAHWLGKFTLIWSGAFTA